MRWSPTKYDERFSVQLETIEGNEHPFFGFRLNKDDAESIELDLHGDTLTHDSFYPLHFMQGNLLYSPQMPDDKHDVFYVNGSYGPHSFFMLELRPPDNVLTGDSYYLNFSESAGDDIGVYEDLLCKNKIDDMPPISPISDYYIGYTLNHSLDKFLIENL